MRRAHLRCRRAKLAGPLRTPGAADRSGHRGPPLRPSRARRGGWCPPGRRRAERTGTRTCCGRHGDFAQHRPAHVAGRVPRPVSRGRDHLAEDSSEQLIEGLRSGRLDAAIISLGATPLPDLETHTVTDEAIAAAVTPSDDLATRSTIPLKSLRDRALVSLPSGTGIRSLFDSACAAAGFTPYVAFEASTPAVLAQLAARGLGIAILPASIATTREDLHPLTITRPKLRGSLAFAWRAEGPISPAARALIARARGMH